MPEKPSYLTSTTSQLLVITVAGYLLGSLILVFKGGGTLEPIKWLIEIILLLYGVRTGANAVMRTMGGANGTAKPAAESSENPTAAPGG